MESFINKKILRKEILDKRKKIDVTEKEKMDERILETVYSSEYYKLAKNIFCLYIVWHWNKYKRFYKGIFK